MLIDDNKSLTLDLVLDDSRIHKRRCVNGAFIAGETHLSLNRLQGANLDWLLIDPSTGDRGHVAHVDRTMRMSARIWEIDNELVALCNLAGVRCRRDR